ncbi:hypothetical protein [Streptomyces sp. NPDC001914]|uniref:hypothetical protein n=1 Tax=Streptomyces sp. NPDC001914 TaxID=3364623 RepID=UPI0036C94095
MSESSGLPAAQQRRIVRQLLGDIATRLETNRPDRPFTAVSRIAVIQATTMDPVLGRAVRDMAPDVHGETTRRAYAARLRRILTGGAR